MHCYPCVRAVRTIYYCKEVRYFKCCRWRWLIISCYAYSYRGPLFSLPRETVTLMSFFQFCGGDDDRVSFCGIFDPQSPNINNFYTRRHRVTHRYVMTRTMRRLSRGQTPHLYTATVCVCVSAFLANGEEERTTDISENEVVYCVLPEYSNLKYRRWPTRLVGLSFLVTTSGNNSQRTSRRRVSVVIGRMSNKLVPHAAQRFMTRRTIAGEKLFLLDCHRISRIYRRRSLLRDATTLASESC